MTGSAEPPDSLGEPTDEIAVGRPRFVAPTDAVEVEPAEPLHLDDDAQLADDELDSEFAPQPRKKLGVLTIGLAALLVAGGGFLAGVQVQQHTGSSSSGNPAAAIRRAGGGTGTGAAGAGGAFAGGAGGFAGRGGGGAGGTGAGAGGTGAGGTGAGTGSSNIPAVIGQIVSVNGDTVVVKNLGGAMITVKLSDTTTITQVATTADLKAGQNVTVSGTTGADGTVAATTVGTR